LRIDMWNDDDWRQLSMGAQHLYMLMLTHGSLSYAGVCDWRPARLAAVTKDRTAADVQRDAEELRAAAFIWWDDDTEEAVIRSFIRHDGLLKHPRLPVSMANDHASIASETIRAGVVFELRKLHDEDPELGAWGKKQVQTILRSNAVDLKALCQRIRIADPKAMPKDSYSDSIASANAMARESNSADMLTATATATSTSNEVDGVNSPSVTRGKNGTRIPANFKPDATMIRWAQDNAPNVDWATSTRKFSAHYRSAAGNAQFKTDWTAAWEAWLIGDQQKAATHSKPSTSDKMRDTITRAAALQARHDEQSQLQIGARP
jgi:hypothetical protein